MPEFTPAPFEEFVRSDRARLVRFLIKLGAQFADADDLAAVTVEKLWEHQHEVDPAKAKAWCITTARRLFLDHCRARNRDLSREEELVQSFDGSVPAAEDLTMLMEEQRTVVAILRTLPMRQREALALRMEGFSSKEIAELVESTAAAIDSNIRHAKQKLKEQVTKSGAYDPGLTGEGGS